MIDVRFVLPVAVLPYEGGKSNFFSRPRKNFLFRPAAGKFELSGFGIEFEVIPAARTFFAADRCPFPFGIEKKRLLSILFP